MWKLSRMKGSVELLSTAMRTIDLELMFVNYVQFWINFHSFKLRYFHLTLTWSIFQSRKYGLIDKFPNFRVNNYFCQIPLQSVFEVLFINEFFFRTLGSLLFARVIKSTSRRKPFKCKPPEVHFTIRRRVPYNKQFTNWACSSRTGKYWPSVVAVRTATTSGQYSQVRPRVRLVSGYYFSEQRKK